MDKLLPSYVTKHAKLINTDELKAYEKSYTDFLSDRWDHPENYRNDDPGPYIDPDMKEGIKRVNPKFYSDLCTFLNREAKEEKYSFSENDLFIRSADGVELVSDQFGFSAPRDFKHPYDIYLKKAKAEGKSKESAIKNVVRWVMESRTIGGSFLWPKNVYGGSSGRWGYNIERGGANPLDENNHFKGGKLADFYIEDRVDLTLSEIKHYLNHENQASDILPQWTKDPLEEKWLRSFSDFQGYVDFFCFNPFVDETNNYIPYDIVKSDLLIGEKVRVDENDPSYRNREKSSIYYLSSDELERMFNNVNIMLKARSGLMLNKIKKG